MPRACQPALRFSRSDFSTALAGRDSQSGIGYKNSASTRTADVGHSSIRREGAGKAPYPTVRLSSGKRGSAISAVLECQVAF